MELIDNIYGEGTNPIIGCLMLIVAGLIVIAAIASFITEIFLSIKYIKFNRKENSAGLTGEEAARKILDDNGLENIKVKCTGSILFGNSYSHYFKKVRLRRLTWRKKSITSLAMAGQKSSLAIMDKENDPDMKKRIRLTPVIYFGPYAFVPLLIIGVLLDIIIFQSQGVCTVICALLGLAFYVVAFVFSMMELKTEKKAQDKCVEVLQNENMANEEELEMMKELFKLYNIEYINNMIIAFLELIYRILMILSKVSSSGSSADSD